MVATADADVTLRRAAAANAQSKRDRVSRAPSMHLALFKLIEDSKWTEAVEFCKENPNEASKWVIKRDKGGSVIWRSLPLHEACTRQPNEGVIDALLEAYAPAVRGKDQEGRLPLHHACVHGLSAPLVHKLLLAYPDAINCEDAWNQKPFDCAQMSTGLHRDEIIDALAKGPSYWMLKNQEIKLTAEEDKRVNAITNEFEAERRRLQEKIKELESNQTALVSKVETLDDSHNTKTLTLCTLEAKVDVLTTKLIDTSVSNNALEKKLKSSEEEVASLNKALADLSESERSLRVKCEELSAKENQSAMTYTELEKKCAAVGDEAARLNDKLRKTTISERSLNTAVEQLKTKLADAYVANSKLERILSTTKSKCESLEEELSVTLESEKSLKTEVGTMANKLRAAEESVSTTTTSYDEQKRTFDEQREILKKKLLELTTEKMELEERVSTNEAHLGRISKKAEESYLTSAECINDLKQKLATANHLRNVSDEAHYEEKKVLTEKVLSLESTVSKLQGELGNQQDKAVARLSNLESRLKKSAEEQARMMMESLFAEKESIMTTPT